MYGLNTTPRHQIFRLRQNKGNHFAPGKFYHDTYTQIFTLQVLGRNERESEPILKASKNRLKFYIVNKVCQTGQKYTFYVQI